MPIILCCKFFEELPIFQSSILIQINDENLHLRKFNPNVSLCLYEYDSTYQGGEYSNSITILLCFRRCYTISSLIQFIIFHIHCLGEALLNMYSLLYDSNHKKMIRSIVKVELKNSAYNFNELSVIHFLNLTKTYFKMIITF